MKNFYTYMWLREDGTPYYIGKGRGKRAIRKGSPQDRSRILLQFFTDERESLVAEKMLIGLYGRRDTGAGTLINRTDGGEGISGYRHTQAYKDKRSEEMLGNTNGVGYRHTFEARQRIGYAARNRSAAVLSRLSAARLGKRKHPHRFESRLQMSRALQKLSDAQVLEIQQLGCTEPQANLAKRYGVHQSTISRIVRQKRHYSTEKALYAIA